MQSNSSQTSASSQRCPCHSGKLYQDCCQHYHQGEWPKTALALMRSRYAAYALGLADYIMSTTYASHPNFQLNQIEWKQQILLFSSMTTFENLEILEDYEDRSEAEVIFIAYLKQGGRDMSFKEKSHFRRELGQWFYESGEVTSVS